MKTNAWAIVCFVLAGCSSGTGRDDIGRRSEALHSDGPSDTRRVEVCHEGQTLRIAESALPAHLKHGDDPGACSSGCTDDSCDDGNACTADRCGADGACEHTFVSCNDGNPCTLDACDPAVGCTSAPNDGVACDDGNDCTNPDACRGGACAGSPIAGCCLADAQCDDGSACTADQCVQRSCVNVPLQCPTGDRCVVGFCDPQTGGCATTPVACTDGRLCDSTTGQCVQCRLGVDADCPNATDPVCVNAGGQNTCSGCTSNDHCQRFGPTEVCDTSTGDCVGCVTDLDCVSPSAPRCVNRTCVPGEPPITRTIPGFNGQLGPDYSGAGWTQCVGYLDRSNIDDIPNAGWANPCIGTGYDKIRVACGASASSVRFIDVNRNVFATGLSAYPETGLITNANFPLPQNDIYASGNQPNTGTSWWISGNGCSESSVSLTINNGCSWDAADCFGQNLAGDRFLYVYVHGGCSGSCNDGNACTADRCGNAGACEHTPILCNDGNPCTVDACDPAVGCTSAPIDGVACDDGDHCTGGDVCQAGHCSGSPIAACCVTNAECDDGNPCTADGCRVDGSCEHNSVTCDDGNPCTVDACDPGVGCSSGPIDGVACDDGNQCTSGDVCQAGVCTGSPIATCFTRTIPGFNGQLGPDYSAAGWTQCVGYLDRVNIDDIPNVGWASPCIGAGYNKVRVACGANANSVRYIDVNRNVFATGLSAYPETGLITNANFPLPQNDIYATGNQPNTGTSWWISGNGCSESSVSLTINNACSWDAADCFGQNLAGDRYLFVFVRQ